MALHFIATSVLTSDGIDGGKEEALETEEARRSRKEAEEAGRKPLFEQLRMLKEKQQEEFDANTKLMYGPQMALTEEDAEYLDDVERTRSKAMEARAVTEQRALEAFRAARSQLVVSSSVVALEGNSTYADPSRVPVAGAPLSAASSSSTAATAAGAGGGYLVIPAKKDNASTFTAQPVITAKKRRKVDDAHGNSSNSSSNSGNASSNGSGGKSGGGGGDGQEPSKRAKGAAEGDDPKPSNAGVATAGPAGGGGGAALSLLGGYGSDEDED